MLANLKIYNIDRQPVGVFPHPYRTKTKKQIYCQLSKSYQIRQSAALLFYFILLSEALRVCARLWHWKLRSTLRVVAQSNKR